MHTTRLKKNFDKKEFQTGASIFKQASWYLTSLLLFRSGIIPFSSLLVILLRCFGAQIGKNVRIKPHIYIKYPWKLTIGDHSWLADCYIENLDQVYIGNHVCISQRAMVLTGSHDYKKPAFDLITKPVTIENGAWICANTTVAPGVWVGAGSVLIAGSVATSDLAPNTIYQGNPARIKRKRY
jgi:putative colanic acid biosynthesis acetyltransferase WcaF